MDTRQEQLLKAIIEAYIKTAEPIGSTFLAEQGVFELSGATLRNEMRELEDAGYLTHPHTSAGRVPTERGYTYYVDQLLEPALPGKKVRQDVDGIVTHDDEVQRLKLFGKYVSGYTNTAVIIARDRDSLYYTGLSCLFAQPELQNYAHALNISTMFDQCEDRVPALFDLVVKEPIATVIGSKNPLGAGCGTVVSRLGDKGLFAVVGPMRMDYAKTIGILAYVTKHDNT